MLAEHGLRSKRCQSHLSCLINDKSRAAYLSASLGFTGRVDCVPGGTLVVRGGVADTIVGECRGVDELLAVRCKVDGRLCRTQAGVLVASAAQGDAGVAAHLRGSARGVSVRMVARVRSVYGHGGASAKDQEGGRDEGWEGEHVGRCGQKGKVRYSSLKAVSGLLIAVDRCSPRSVLP